MKKMSYDELLDLDLLLHRYMHDCRESGESTKELIGRFMPLLDEIGEAEDRAAAEEAKENGGI